MEGRQSAAASGVRNRGLGRSMGDARGDADGCGASSGHTAGRTCQNALNGPLQICASHCMKLSSKKELSINTTFYLMMYLLKHLGRKVLISATCLEMHQKVARAGGRGEEYMDGYVTEVGVAEL